jgi:hypothetical protein
VRPREWPRLRPLRFAVAWIALGVVAALVILWPNGDHPKPAEGLAAPTERAEVVATLVGSIGLIGAVPITTALAARLVPESALGDAGDDHGHYH